MDTQVADTLLGSLIDGRYRIRGRVARGGMATVYTATDERLERTVALKIIHPTQAPRGPARIASFVDRFTDEAKTIARLTHPNVVAVYDQGTHAGLPYLVMEYVRGRTLRDVLAERRRLNPDEALAILEQMLAAIAAAHRAGLVHRDVKPENVLVAEAPTGGAANLVDSVVKVADFGLARAVEASAEERAGGQLMATVAYVAPELVTDGHADPRTDVYSAGIVLFEMLTGRVPYDGGPPGRRRLAARRPGRAGAVDAGAGPAAGRSTSWSPGPPGAIPAPGPPTPARCWPRCRSPGTTWATPTATPPCCRQRRSVARPADHDGRAGPAGRPPVLGAAARAAPAGRGGRAASGRAAPRTGLGARLGCAAPARSLSNPPRPAGRRGRGGDLGLVAAIGGWWFGVGRYTALRSW